MGDHIFWRTTDGGLSRKREHAPLVALAKFGEEARVGARGEIMWEVTTRFTDIESILAETIAVKDAYGQELGEQDTWALVYQAIKKAIRTKGGGVPVEPALLMKFGDDIVAKHLRKVEESYVMVTGMSIPHLPARGVNVRGRKIASIRDRGNKYGFPDMVRTLQNPIYREHAEGSKYAVIRVSTSGRSEYEAFERAIHALDLTRGIWTLAGTFQRVETTFGRRWKPLGPIRLSPIHTLHLKDGSLVGNCWLEPDATRDLKLFKPERGWPQVEQLRRNTARKLIYHPFRVELEGLIIRYVNALDNTNLNGALLNLWGILETITDMGKPRYDEMIRRSIRIYKDPEFPREELTAIRVCRNRYVHAASSITHAEHLAYRLKVLVETHLAVMLDNPFKAASIEEYAFALSMPQDVGDLKARASKLAREQTLIESVIRVTEHWRT